jgi:hypothetical protein
VRAFVSRKNDLSLAKSCSMGTMYKDLGRNHFDRRSTDQQKNRLVKRLADLGYAVEIKPLAA